MKTLTNLILTLSLLTFVSCSDNSKDLTSDQSSKTNTTMSTITWTKNADPDLVSGKSNALTEDDLTSELIQIFNKIKTEKLLLTSKILVFIDATNSIIFFSDADSDEDEDDISSSKTVSVSFENSELLAADNKNAAYFENAALASLKLAIKNNKKIMAEYTVYLRTDAEDEAVILDKNGL